MGVCFIARVGDERNTPRSRMIDPALFDPAAVSDEIRAQNEAILARLAALPEPSSVPPSVIRERRRQGLGPFPDMPLSARAKVDRDRWAGRAHPAADHRAGATQGRLFPYPWRRLDMGHGRRAGPLARPSGGALRIWRSCRWNIGWRPKILTRPAPDDCEAAALMGAA